MKKLVGISLLISAVFVITACSEVKSENNKIKKEKTIMQNNNKYKKAVFGEGCFWCSEAVFERINGVVDVVSGYAGGNIDDPSYEQVCSGTTGHAEVVQIIYEPEIVSYDELLKIFWKTHDPTTLNRQGADVGTQYRSVIFYLDKEQKDKAEKYKEELDKSGAFNKKIVTEISPLTNFYKAEDYHQDYYEKNPNQGYCAFVIAPKIEKLEKIFNDKLK